MLRWPTLIVAGVLAAALLGPRSVVAQDTLAPPVTTPAPSWRIVEPATPKPLRLEPSRLRPGSYRYEVVITGDSASHIVGTHLVNVSEGLFAGRAAWSVVDVRESHPPFVVLSAVDTVMLDPSSLQTLRWDGAAGGARFVAAFGNDSVYGGASSGGGRTTFSIPAPQNLVTSEGALDALLQAAPLDTGWAAEATMLVVDLDGARALPLQLTVEREERLELPTGSFDVWTVSIRGGGSERWLWIDKSTQVVLRTASSPPHMPGMIVERVLAHAPIVPVQPAPAEP